MKKIAAILQNQWFRNPTRAAEMLARLVERHGLAMRNEWIARMLFHSCHTGKVLRSCLGDALCDRITWEEASPIIHGDPRTAPPADHAHLSAFFDRVRPDVVIGFGRIACDAILHLCKSPHVILCPHPTSRGADRFEKIRIVPATIAELEAFQV